MERQMKMEVQMGMIRIQGGGGYPLRARPRGGWSGAPLDGVRQF